MTSEKTGNARLLKLAKLLKKLSPKRFDYNVWVGDDWKGAPDLSCGTTACALGWATTIPSLRRIGLRLEPDPYGGGTVGLRGKKVDSIDAAMEVFALSEGAACNLFGGGSGNAKSVAKKIEQYVAARA